MPTDMDSDSVDSLEALGPAITQALADHPVGVVMSVLGGALITLAEDDARLSGNDPDETLHLTGFAERVITIQAAE